MGFQQPQGLPWVQTPAGVGSYYALQQGDITLKKEKSWTEILVQQYDGMNWTIVIKIGMAYTDWTIFWDQDVNVFWLYGYTVVHK